LRIAQRQGLRAARARAQAVDVAAAGLDPDHVVADTADLLLDLVGRPLAHRHAADDRAHADDDAQHGQNAAHLVARERSQRDSKQLAEIKHATSLDSLDLPRRSKESILPPESSPRA